MSSPQNADGDNSVAQSSEAATINSSSQGPPVSNGSKEKRNPSITPRKFKKFWTPQPQRSYGAPNGPSRRGLLFVQNLRSSHLPSGQNVQSSPVQPPAFDEENPSPDFPRHLKRQKRSHILDAGESKDLSFAPAHHEPNSESRSGSNNEEIQSSPCPRGSGSCLRTDESSDSDEEEAIETPRPNVANPKQLAKPVQRWNYDGGLSAQLFEMQLGRGSRPGRLRYDYPINGMFTGCFCRAALTIADWRDNTANFYSTPDDVHDVMSLGSGEPKRTIPFVALGLNSKLSLPLAAENQ